MAHSLVDLGANILLVDSLIPEYGGNTYNVEHINDAVRINVSDIRDEYSMRYLIQGQDYLFNLAGQTSHIDSMQNPYADLEINCHAQLSLLESCRKYNSNIKIVFASTRQIYGKPNYLPVDERHILQPTDVNGINKMAGEWYHVLYNNVYGIKACVLRLTNTYGPRMRIMDARQTFLGIWIRLLVENKPFDVYGDGTQIRDFNYVDDVVNALLLAASCNTANGDVFNLGSSEKISLKELAQMLIKINGQGIYRVIPFPLDRKVIDIGNYYADYSKITSIMGWAPKISLSQGLANTLHYYQKYYKYYV